jgi:transposase
MDLDELAKRALSLGEPWIIEGAELLDGAEEVEVRVSHGGRTEACPECGATCKKHDTVERRWRHLDMWDYRTWIVCRVPRVACEKHGVRKVDVPWADGWARFTSRFECVVIDWLKESSMSAVARNLHLSWAQVAGIQSRAVKRGLARREALRPERIGVDETSFQKRHEYVTILTDLEGSRVLNVTDGRGKATLDSFFEGLGPERTSSIKLVAMDMHAAYIYSAADHLDDICDKICFDRFHVAQMFSKVVDQVRRAERKRLAAEGEDCLNGTRYMWLKAVKDLPRKLRAELSEIAATATSVAQVWAIKEAASKLWHYKSKTWARKAWIQLCKMAFQLGIPALDRVAQTIVNHLYGIENAIVHRVSNASSESINSRVQALKKRANGYRNRERFRDAIYFHLGGLDLYPRKSIHSNP